MSHSALQASTLLSYNADFRLLICRKCQHAIQRSAVDSHLLKHKIYRSERRELLADIKRLDLPDAEHVALPPPESRPIDGLPVLTGYRCYYGDCRHLTASEKRMKRHWSDYHGEGRHVPALSEFSQRVHLQTFFRGTKVRYFEVTPHVDSSTSANTVNGESTELNKPSREQRLGSEHSSISNPQDIVTVDLDTLRLLHHFIKTTATTLPGSSDYWQHQVVPEALRSNALMCGILAISAAHTMILSENSLSQHCVSAELQTKYSREFTNTFGFNEGVNAQRYVPETGQLSQPVVDHIASLLQCVRWSTTNATDFANDDKPSSQLPGILDAIHGCTPPDSTLETTKPQQRERRRANDNVEPLCSKDCNEFQHILRTLPSRMIEPLGRPDSTQAFFATIASIDSLIECCDISFASNESEIACHAVGKWLTAFLSRSTGIKSKYTPADLILLAHWAAFLVTRAERLGCWYWKGLASNLLRVIVSELSTANAAALPLVKVLIDRVEVLEG